MKILNKLELMSPSIKVGGSNGYVVELPESAGALLSEESINSLISTAETEAIRESKSYTDQKVSSVYRVKGSVPSIEDLPENAEVGDVYNISDDLSGHNYVKTEDGWDKLGGTVDLSPYALKTDVSGCVEALEDKITAAQNSAVFTSNAYTDACIVAANLSQYAKAEDVYTKTAADSTFVKVGDDTTGDVDADKVEANYLKVVCGEFCALTICGENVVTEGYLYNYLPVNSFACETNGHVTYCIEGEVNFICGISIDGREVATQDYVCTTISGAIGCLKYLPAAQCGGIDPYIVCSAVKFTETLTYGESEVATVADILPVCGPINLCNGRTGYIVEQEVDFVLGANFWGNFSICCSVNATYGGSRIATEADIPTDFYTTCAADEKFELSGSANAVKTELSGCMAAIEGCIAAVEEKIPTDYLPATKINNNLYDASSTNLTLFGLNVVCGVNLPVHTSVDGECVATKPYVDQAGSDAFCAAQAYTDEKIASLGSVLEYKGNKTYAELPTEGNDVGDVYNITADYAEKGIKAGDNVVWNGSDWDVLSAPIDLSGYYDKEEVDAALEGYLPVESGYYEYSYDSVDTSLRFYNHGIEVMRLCGGGHVVFPTPPVDNNGSEFTTKAYIDLVCSAINTKLGEKADKSTTYTKDEVNNALEGYLPVTAMDEIHCTGFKYTVDGRLFIGKEGESQVTSISYQHFCTYNIQACTVDLVSEPTRDRHATPKSYVDNLVSTSISAVNANLVYDEDFILGDGTFDASTSQMKWTVSPEGATKILSVIALDSDGNLVHPSYKWANNTLTVGIFAEAEQNNPGYTVTVSYKK